MFESVYNVCVGGTEVNEYYLSKEEAVELASEYKEDGYYPKIQEVTENE